MSTKKSKWTKEKIEKFLIEIGHAEITIDYSVYKGTKTKCKFIDSEYGEWWALPDNVIHKKSRHPKRGHKKGGGKSRNTIEKVKSKIKEHYGDLVTIDESTYTTGKEKARFIDKDYGEFWCQTQAIVSGMRHGHPMRGASIVGKSLMVPFEEAVERIKKVWGDEIQILEEDYVGFGQKCKFKHKIYGVWKADPRNVESGHGHPLAGIEKQKETMMERYGVEKPTQHKPFAIKAARSGNRRVLVKHWRTGEEIICTASYEYAVIKKLNELEIDYITQIPFEVFIDEQKRIYFIDLYLPERDVYIEIKGFFRDTGKKKWLEFNKKYSNSELWQLDEVKKFSEKTEYRLTKDFKTALLEQCKPSQSASTEVNFTD